MNGTYTIVAQGGIVVDGKAADHAVVEAMRASGVIDPSYGAVCNAHSPVVAYFPAAGYTAEDVSAVLNHIVETLLPTEYRVPANI